MAELVEDDEFGGEVDGEDCDQHSTSHTRTSFNSPSHALPLNVISISRAMVHGMIMRRKKLRSTLVMEAIPRDVQGRCPR